MNKSILLTVMLIGTLIPGMVLSMPGISVTGSHMQSNNNSNNKMIQEAFAQYNEHRHDNYNYNYNNNNNYGYGYEDNNNYNKDNYNYNTYENKKAQPTDYTYADYKKKKNYAEIERFDDKLFVCDNGIVVDDRTQCPLKCPFGTTLEGAYVMDLEICDIEPGTVSKKCPQGTDLEGVLVTNKNQCDLF